MWMSISSIKAQYNAINLRLEPASPEKRFTFQKLRLYPVRANNAFFVCHKDVGKYVTLQEALEKKNVAISEYGNGSSSGAVNTLLIENVSTDTIMVLAGEVVQGGNQDRMIAKDFILYPKSGKKDVSVFCVEHGRWQPNRGDMSFHEYFTISSNDVRKAGTVAKNQQEVWNKVAATTGKNKAETKTGTLTALQRSDSFNTILANHTGYFGELFLKEPDVIGVIAVSGDSILGCDMFATHGMFEKNYHNLLNSYATEAITSGSEVNVAYEKVKKYLDTIIDDERNQEKEVEKKGTMLKDGNRKIHISTF